MNINIIAQLNRNSKAGLPYSTTATTASHFIARDFYPHPARGHGQNKIKGGNQLQSKNISSQFTKDFYFPAIALVKKIKMLSGSSNQGSGGELNW